MISKSFPQKYISMVFRCRWPTASNLAPETTKPLIKQVFFVSPGGRHKDLIKSYNYAIHPLIVMGHHGTHCDQINVPVSPDGRHRIHLKLCHFFFVQRMIGMGNTGTILDTHAFAWPAGRHKDFMEPYNPATHPLNLVGNLGNHWSPLHPTPPQPDHMHLIGITHAAQRL